MKRNKYRLASRARRNYFVQLYCKLSKINSQIELIETSFADGSFNRLFRNT